VYRNLENNALLIKTSSKIKPKNEWIRIPYTRVNLTKSIPTKTIK
jgi:hypothetical protein